MDGFTFPEIGAAGMEGPPGIPPNSFACTIEGGMVDNILLGGNLS